MKKSWENVVVKIIMFENEDVVRTSDPYEGEIDWRTFRED